MNLSHTGHGKVYLLAGGGRIYSEIVAKFCRTEKDVESVVAEPYVKGLLKNLISSGHQAALEFDNYIFGVEGYSRVTEIQLIRKRHASYMIKSGRPDKGGKRSYDIVLPENIMKNQVIAPIDVSKAQVLIGQDGTQVFVSVEKLINVYREADKDILDKYGILSAPAELSATLDTKDLLNILEVWYANGVASGLPEEDLRYMKPQGTEFKAAIMMNASGLMDWFKIRLCNRASHEIRDLAWKMYHRLMEVHPDIFEECGPSCKVLGYCPEMDQCAEFKGIIPSKKEALEIIRTHYVKSEGAGPLYDKGGDIVPSPDQETVGNILNEEET